MEFFSIRLQNSALITSLFTFNVCKFVCLVTFSKIQVIKLYSKLSKLCFYYKISHVKVVLFIYFLGKWHNLRGLGGQWPVKKYGISSMQTHQLHQDVLSIILIITTILLLMRAEATMSPSFPAMLTMTTATQELSSPLRLQLRFKLSAISTVVA